MFGEEFDIFQSTPDLMMIPMIHVTRDLSFFRRKQTHQSRRIPPVQIIHSELGILPLLVLMPPLVIDYRRHWYQYAHYYKDSRHYLESYQD